MQEPKEREYFHELVEPHLVDGIEYLGEVTHGEKVELLQNARATLFPIEWEEPFGLVMIESMACGTPVIATRWGAVPEVIEHGRSGIIVDNYREMAGGARARPTSSIRSSSGATSRRSSRRERMVRDYVEAYETAIAQRRLGPGPGVRPAVPAVGLEPRVHARGLPPPERLPRVVEGEPVDPGEVGVVLDRHDATEQADVAVPVVTVENRQARAWITAQDAERSRLASMLSRTRPSSQAYQVATECGEPSGLIVATTAGCGRERTRRPRAGPERRHQAASAASRRRASKSGVRLPEGHRPLVGVGVHVPLLAERRADGVSELLFRQVIVDPCLPTVRQAAAQLLDVNRARRGAALPPTTVGSWVDDGLSEEEFADAVRASLREQGDVDVDAYERAMPFWQSYAGLRRAAEKQRRTA